MNNEGKKKTIIYVTREYERAAGKKVSEDYRVVTNATKDALQMEKQFPDFILTIKDEGGKILGTSELLAHPKFKERYSTKNKDDFAILVFKNTKRVEESAKENGWSLINPSADLSEKVENKISQIEWLQNLSDKYLPPRRVALTKNIVWKGEPFVLQWAHGHTGNGTILVKDKDYLFRIKENFPERIARITKYIEGPTFTINAVVGKDKILAGNISYQITGMSPFTNSMFATVGNDWKVANELLNLEDKEYIEKMIRDIGTKLNISGWRGLFGIDIVKEDKTGKIYLIEINARQPASTSFESELQIEKRESGNKGLTTFEAHIRSLLNQNIDNEIIRITDGAQIVLRINENRRTISNEVIHRLATIGLNTIEYQNEKINEDLLRIQSRSGIMMKHSGFNDLGLSIAKIFE